MIDLTKILTDVANLKSMYYGTLYLKPVVSRYGTITEYTQYIRQTILAVTHGETAPSYKVTTYDSLYDWIDGADIVPSFTLWLTEVITLYEMFDNIDTAVVKYNTLYTILSEELSDILSVVSDIQDESANMLL